MSLLGCCWFVLGNILIGIRRGLNSDRRRYLATLRRDLLGFELQNPKCRCQRVSLPPVGHFGYGIDIGTEMDPQS